MGRKPKQALIYRQEMESGLTCKEIAAKYGISTQAVYAACCKVHKTYFRKYSREACIWPGLRDWLNDNQVSRRELLQLMDMEYGSTNLEKLRERLQGNRDLRLSFIRKIMAITGLSFEELFGEG